MEDVVGAVLAAGHGVDDLAVAALFDEDGVRRQQHHRRRIAEVVAVRNDAVGVAVQQQRRDHRRHRLHAGEAGFGALEQRWRVDLFVVAVAVQPEPADRVGDQLHAPVRGGKGQDLFAVDA